MTASEQRYLRYVRDSIQRIQRHLPASPDEFVADEVVQDMVTWRLQTIADAARSQLSDELKARHPEVPWREVYGFRNIAAHGYGSLNLGLVWEIARQHLEALAQAVESELAREGDRP